VVGGASGLGEAAARGLVEVGVECLIIDIDDTRGEALAESIGPHASYRHADVTDSEALAAAIGPVHELPLRIVVNTAFVPGGQRLIGRNEQPHDLALFRRLLEVNLLGTFDCMRLGAAAISKAPPLENGERGVIINTASIVAFDGQEGQCAYAAAKAAIAGMTLPAARDLRTRGIRVVAIAPGTFATPPVQALPPDTLSTYRDTTLAPGRLGHPREFGQFVVHICQNSYLNGDTFRLDGGARLPAWRT
jgi:NAD(P)-dependent dehydrogenase (short-subunit alcohol dehydrogenase family)